MAVMTMAAVYCEAQTILHNALSTNDINEAIKTLENDDYTFAPDGKYAWNGCKIGEVDIRIDMRMNGKIKEAEAYIKGDAADLLQMYEDMNTDIVRGESEDGDETWSIEEIDYSVVIVRMKDETIWIYTPKDLNGGGGIMNFFKR